MVPSSSAMGETAWSCPCLAPQTCSVPDSVRTELRTLRLAIAAWEEGASRRAGGGRVRMATAATGPAPSQVADGHPNSPTGEEGNEQAWREH